MKRDDEVVYCGGGITLLKDDVVEVPGGLIGRDGIAGDVL